MGFSIQGNELESGKHYVLEFSFQGDRFPFGDYE